MASLLWLPVALKRGRVSLRKQLDPHANLGSDIGIASVASVSWLLVGLDLPVRAAAEGSLSDLHSDSSRVSLRCDSGAALVLLSLMGFWLVLAASSTGVRRRRERPP